MLIASQNVKDHIDFYHIIKGLIPALCVRHSGQIPIKSKAIMDSGAAYKAHPEEDFYVEQSTRRILGLVVAGSLLFAFFTGAPRVVQSLIDMIGQRHQTPKQVIIEFQKALHELDDPAANELFLTTDDESESSSFEWTSEEELHFNELYTHFEVEILDSRINGDNAVVTTRLSNLNMDHVYETFSANFYNYEYDNQILAEDADPYVEIDKIFLDRALKA